jgi:DNA replication protein DnaC
MLTHPTLDKLQALRLHGMAKALREHLDMPDIATLSFEERFGLLVDREVTARETRRLTTPLRQAKLRQAACCEDLDYRPARGLDKTLMTSLMTCQGGREHRNVLITGSTGVGKTGVACALGQQACRLGFTVLYLRLPRLFQDLLLAQGDGRSPKVMAMRAKTDLVILDDWGLAARNDDNRRDLLEVLEDRQDRRATLVTSQLPVDHWHDALGEPTLADAILDRLVHNASKIALHGESMRKRQAKVTRGGASE